MKSIFDLCFQHLNKVCNLKVTAYLKQLKIFLNKSSIIYLFAFVVDVESSLLSITGAAAPSALK
jgi:hypothetical protein